MLENLLLCRPDATRQQAVEACKRAGIHDEIMALAEGYDTVLTGDGGMLSGGQRQMLSLARTLLRDADTILLDEAFSAIDKGRAAQIMENLRRAYPEKR